MTRSLVYLCFFLSLLQSLMITTTAQAYHNITLGSSLTASTDNSSWTSPSGDFAFGFRPIGTNALLLSIWFDKIPEKTIVWCANQGNPVQLGSKVELTNGQLVLYDLQGQEIWKTGQVLSEKVGYASMLDTGNFVLKSNNADIIWGSFQVPTDTILPSQILEAGSRLVSRVTDTNYSSGRFQLRLEEKGSLVLSLITFTTQYFYDSYWESIGSHLVFNQSGYIYLTNNRSIINLTPDVVLQGGFYHRATLDSDGVFRQYYYPKTTITNNGTSSKSWTTLGVTPPNICLTIIKQHDSGYCGYNSYCKLDKDQNPTCECPPGYTYMDPNNKLNGCEQKNFVSQSCNSGSQETSLFEMAEVLGADFPGNDYENYVPVTKDWCSKSCLTDCFCAAAVFGSGNCWKKGIPLRNGKTDPSTISLVKLQRGNSSERGPRNGKCNNSKEERLATVIIVVLVLLGSSVFLNMLSLSRFTKCRYSTTSRKIHTSMPHTNLPTCSYKQMQKATSQFKEELGRGASAIVYKGVLTLEEITTVAVKKLEKMVEGEKEFLAEVSAIARTNHKNLVQLLGFCNEGTNRLLVYEFMSNGSLASFLFGSSRPKWCDRIQLVCGIARGLAYLHEECSTPIIHCDIKPQNILLDDSFTPRISDFGLAKLLKFDQTQTSTGVRGTTGYVAPEWFLNKAITVKVDVYSFGIMLLEIICCRRNVEFGQKDENKVILTDWAYDCCIDGRLDALVENDEEATHDIERLAKLVMVAIWCIQDEPLSRPTMSSVIQMLHESVVVSIPPNPSFFVSSV